MHFKEAGCYYGNRKARSVSPSRGHFGAPKPKCLLVSSSHTVVELGFSSTDKYIDEIDSIVNFFNNHLFKFLCM